MNTQSNELCEQIRLAEAIVQDIACLLEIEQEYNGQPWTCHDGTPLVRRIQQHLGVE